MGSMLRLMLILLVPLTNSADRTDNARIVNICRLCLDIVKEELSTSVIVEHLLASFKFCFIKVSSRIFDQVSSVTFWGLLGKGFVVCLLEIKKNKKKKQRVCKFCQLLLL